MSSPGDVGCGKSALAESIADPVAREQRIQITLFPMSLSARGQGRVGEMTRLLSTAFDYTYSEAKKLACENGEGSRGAVILLIDEADALAQSREAAQMHHEDRVGVNALIRGVDRLAKSRLPVAVIMCTNRLDALDSAIRRRAADTLAFYRPDRNQHHAVLAGRSSNSACASRTLRKSSTQPVRGLSKRAEPSALRSRILPSACCPRSCSMPSHRVQSITGRRWRSPAPCAQRAHSWKRSSPQVGKRTRESLTTWLITALSAEAPCRKGISP